MSISCRPHDEDDAKTWANFALMISIASLRSVDRAKPQLAQGHRERLTSPACWRAPV